MSPQEATAEQAWAAYTGIVEAVRRRYGSLEAWREAGYGFRFTPEEKKMAYIISSLLRDTPNKPRGSLHPAHQQRLEADHDLWAYWSSVIEADAWDEERARLNRRQREAAASPLPSERLESLDIYAIIGLLPYWRSLGRMLIEAGVVRIDTFSLPNQSGTKREND